MFAQMHKGLTIAEKPGFWHHHQFHQALLFLGGCQHQLQIGLNVVEPGGIKALTDGTVQTVIANDAGTDTAVAGQPGSNVAAVDRVLIGQSRSGRGWNFGRD